MGPHTISVLCLVLLAAQVSAVGLVWEFGKVNTPGSLSVVRKEGHIGLFEHNKKVKLVSEQWEFGVSSTPGSVVVAYNKGQVGLFERTKKINLAVPQCYVITYVSVQIDNLISNPNVDFNTYTSVVTIAYKLWQHSSSTYDIVAKAVWKQGCIIPPAQQQRGKPNS